MRHLTIQHLSQYPMRTLRDLPADEESRNAQLLLKGGFISKTAAGIYSYLPLGLRVLQNIEHIVREEMDRLGSAEVLLPALHPRQLWEETCRWDSVDVLYKLRARTGSEYCLGPTHEEVVTPLAADITYSYRALPFSLYQIQTKFRDEARARSGLLRGREFRMKDMYSFHLTQRDLEDYYSKAIEVYHRIFSRMGIGKDVILTFASGGVFSKFSHEFQLLADTGEDTIFLAPDRSVALNKEVVKDREALRLVFGDVIPTLEEHRSIEVGNIFQLGTRFSNSFGFNIATEDGNHVAPIMGCYGIGTSRLMGAIAERCNDVHGLQWPHSVSPFDVHIVCLEKSDAATRITEQVCQNLGQRYSLLVDDRFTIRAGEKFNDADLIGIPVQIVVGKRALESGEIEIRLRKDRRTTFTAMNTVREFLEALSH